MAVDMKTQAEVLSAGAVFIAAGVFCRDASRSVSAHAGELMVITRDAAGAVLTLAAVAIMLLAARLVARHEGRHCAPPVPPLQPSWAQRRGEPAHTYKLRPQDEQAAPAMEDLFSGGDR